MNYTLKLHLQYNDDERVYKAFELVIAKPEMNGVPLPKRQSSLHCFKYAAVCFIWKY